MIKMTEEIETMGIGSSATQDERTETPLIMVTRNGKPAAPFPFALPTPFLTAKPVMDTAANEADHFLSIGAAREIIQQSLEVGECNPKRAQELLNYFDKIEAKRSK